MSDSEFPRGWKELDAFLHSPDVTPPYGPFLDMALRIWEYGYKRQIPPDLLPFAELLAVRKLADYQRITKAEERVGKYASRFLTPQGTEGPASTTTTAPVKKRKRAKIFRIKQVPPKKPTGGGIVFQAENGDSDSDE